MCVLKFSVAVGTNERHGDFFTAGIHIADAIAQQERAAIFQGM
ncbi:MAG: hypothetical protein M0026_07775 [Nocardiopsaceae bacterium]|nr:hypothetical protein [Nocardiopsaceae bacterium]